jgi:Na+/H+-dicarboxylate symporter
MVIVDPIVNMIRVMLNVAVNCVIPALATGRQLPVSDPELVPAE